MRVAQTGCGFGYWKA